MEQSGRRFKQFRLILYPLIGVGQQQRPFSPFSTVVGIGSFILGIVAAHMGLGQLYLYLGLFVIASIGIYYVLHGRRQTEKKKERQFQVNVQKRVEEEGL